MAGLLFSLLSVSCSDDSQEQSVNLYEVNAPSQLILRSEPSKSGQKIVSIPDKTRIEVEEVENGWAHIKWDDHDGYVNADYIIPVKTESVSQSSTADTSYSEGSSQSLKRLGYEYLPFIVLILFIVAVILLVRDEDSMVPWWLMVVLSIGEIVYMECTSGFMYRYWFLEPLEVGWLWTIVGYALMLGLVIGQGIMVVIWVRSTASGWFNNLLTWGAGLFAGLFFFMMMSTLDKFELIYLIFSLGTIMCLVCLVYYSIRSWSEVWYICLIDMIIIPSFIGLIISLLSHLIIGLIGLIAVSIFSVQGGGGSSRYFYAEDDHGNKIRLKRSYNPNIAHDSYGQMYELYSDGKWRRY
ncbi:MAG: SH3 domain-containing protein [Muribaculaceae bacterium]|nr:SH3 domain-containing protein [Muribaculaceae bacterium]